MRKDRKTYSGMTKAVADIDAAVVLVNPKTPYNVGSVIRACSIFGVPMLRWTGTRIDAANARRKAGSSAHKDRLPREERMKDYYGVDWREGGDRVITELCRKHALTPVAVEVMASAEPLDVFEHPERPLYVFGPEDGSIPPGVLSVCHRFITIPTLTTSPLNLAAAVNIVLYDRYVK